MNRYYTKQKKRNIRKMVRLSGLGVSVIGLIGLMYFSFPILSWQFYFSAFASEGVLSPVPEDSPVQNLISAQTNPLMGTDYSDAHNWFPLKNESTAPAKVATYTLSIPKIKILDATVSTMDTNVGIHMVQYGTNVTPPEKGTSVIFGHSTLPQLYDPKDYKTILANAYTLRKGDSFVATVNGVAYEYKIFNIKVVSPGDLSVFTQKTDDSYLTIVTCTPPGTIWKRLVLQARLQAL